MGWIYIELINIAARERRSIGYVLMNDFNGQILRPWYGSLNSAFDEDDEIAVLFGIDRVEKFLPQDNCVLHEQYELFLHFVEQQIFQKRGVTVKLTDWQTETTLKLQDIHIQAMSEMEERLKRGEYVSSEERKEYDLTIWLENEFAEAYKKWREKGNPSVLRKG